VRKATSHRTPATLTSNLADMRRMFASAHAFNQPLGTAFDTSNVTNMGLMFCGAHAFNQPLGAAFDTCRAARLELLSIQVGGFVLKKTKSQKRNVRTA